MSAVGEFSRARFALATMFAAYPLVTGLLYVVMPLTPEWELWQRTLILVPLIVSAMVWVLIPRVHRHCGRFLLRRRT